MTPSIAVVTKRAGLALTMSSSTHHFVEVRPAAGWQAREWSEDVVVLDLETAESTLSAIETLTGSGVAAPVIVVATDTDGWDELLSLYPDLSLVSLPIMPASMLSAVDRAVRHAQVSRSAPTALNLDPSDPEPSAPAASDAQPTPGSRAAAAAEPASVTTTVTASTPVVSQPAAEAPAPASVIPPTRTAQPPPTPPTPPPPPSPTPRAAVAEKAPTPRKAKRSRRAKPHEPAVLTKPAPPEATAAREAAPQDTEPRRHRVGAPRQGLMTMVRGLSLDTSRLSRVHEVAELIRRRCAGAVACDASAVLVPDGNVWRVSAGEHLRPLEERLQLDAGHWLVTEVAMAKHGVVITDTDIARSKLGGSPLVSWPNLLALPVEGVGAIVLLARGGKGFGKSDLTKVRDALGQAGTQLLDAVDVRDLARKLSSFVDPVD